ncbi:cyclic nucleotide-binding domain-containing protein [Asanoa sp. NPDC049518]|uniref:cyclic nucleotide-binding domain-containing protein n=1 Tax=unclassified Asanoa TaxID=2685164 RepID=UPI003438D1F0
MTASREPPRGSDAEDANTVAVFDLLRAQPLLIGLNDWQLGRLAPLAHRSMFHAGRRVFHPGDPADRLWLIVAGRVDVDLPGPGRVVVDTLGAGNALGWSWLLPPYRWQFGAVAVETTQTVALDGPALRQLCDSDPTLGYPLTLALLHVVADRLRATRHARVEGRPDSSAG